MNRNTLIAGLVLVAIVWGLKTLSSATPDTIPSELPQPVPRMSELPTMSSREVILLVIEDNYRRLGTTPPRNLEVSGDWDATYWGDGAWYVTLRVPGEESFRFVVYEKDKRVQVLSRR